MKTKQQYMDEARAENPKPQYWVADGTQIELTDDEYEESIERWAEMRVAQDKAANTET